MKPWLILPALAWWLGLATAAAESARFLEPEALDVTALLPGPPTDDSPAGLADLETLLQVQAARTPEQMAWVERVADQTVFSFAAPVLGDWFIADRLPRTAEVFQQVTAEAYGVALAAKRQWNRPRPHFRDSRLEPVPRRSRSPAYPSGHASDAATWAVLLTHLYPEQADAWEEQVRVAMWGRVLGGSHYPSDVTAGRILGREIGRKLLESPALRAALEEVRAEIADAGATEP